MAFFDGARALGSDTNAPFELNVYFGLGEHILTAVASDDNGAQTKSFPVTIAVQPPLRIHQP